jgi:hypothetical protein
MRADAMRGLAADAVRIAPSTTMCAGYASDCGGSCHALADVLEFPAIVPFQL